MFDNKGQLMLTTTRLIKILNFDHWDNGLIINNIIFK